MTNRNEVTTVLCCCECFDTAWEYIFHTHTHPQAHVTLCIWVSMILFLNPLHFAATRRKWRFWLLSNSKIGHILSNIHHYTHLRVHVDILNTSLWKLLLLLLFHDCYVSTLARFHSQFCFHFIAHLMHLLRCTFHRRFTHPSTQYSRMHSIYTNIYSSNHV